MSPLIPHRWASYRWTCSFTLLASGTDFPNLPLHLERIGARRQRVENWSKPPQGSTEHFLATPSKMVVNFKRHWCLAALGILYKTLTTGMGSRLTAGNEDEEASISLVASIFWRPPALLWRETYRAGNNYTIAYGLMLHSERWWRRIFVDWRRQSSVWSIGWLSWAPVNNRRMRTNQACGGFRDDAKTWRACGCRHSFGSCLFVRL